MQVPLDNPRIVHACLAACRCWTVLSTRHCEEADGRRGSLNPRSSVLVSDLQEHGRRGWLGRWLQVGVAVGVEGASSCCQAQVWCYNSRPGEVAEWSNVPDSKSGVLQGTVGSNPTLSATGHMKTRKAFGFAGFFLPTFLTPL